MAYTTARWRDKGNAWAGGWFDRLGVLPTLHAVIFGLADGQLESGVGDYWPGPDGIVGTQDDENNVGCCTFRRLNADELAAVHAAGIVPTVGDGHEARAKAAQAAILAAGLPVASGTIAGIEVPFSTIHCDSAPGLGPYFVWFAGFGTLREGCAYHVHLLAEGKPARVVLENPAGNEQALASAMYAARYFTGVHDPKKFYLNGHEVPAGTAGAVNGAQANIDAYAGGLRRWTPEIRAALTGWSPDIGPIDPTPPAITPIDLNNPADLQRALNLLGMARPVLKLDGAIASKTIAALGFYQGTCLDGQGGLVDMTGKFDGPTLAGLRRDLVAMAIPVR